MSGLDDTLFSPDHFLIPYAKETLELLTACGTNLAFAIDCHYIDVGRIRDNPGIWLYMIISSDARAHDNDGQRIFAHNLDRDIAADLLEIVRNDPKIVTNVYREDEWYMNRHHPGEIRFFKKAVFNYKLYESGELDLQGISKVFFTYEDHEHLLPLEQTMNARWGDRMNVSFSILTCLGVMAGGVSREHVLEAVAKMLGYTPTGYIAFGDGTNDAEMLSMAGEGYIMANIHQQLKNLHPELEVIDSSAGDAVSHYLCKLYLD